LFSAKPFSFCSDFIFSLKQVESMAGVYYQEKENEKSCSGAGKESRWPTQLKMLHWYMLELLLSL
jgi:hypothetical protein